MNKSHKLFLAAATVFAVACQKDDRPVKTASAADLTTSASDSSANARGHSQVRVVNAVPGGKEINVNIGETTLFNNVATGTVTDYRETALNIARFKAMPAAGGEGVEVAEKDRLLVDGHRYTVFLINEDMAHSTLRVIRDEVTTDSNKAHVRVLHAAAGGPEVDIGIMGQKDKLFSGVNFKSEAGYKDIEPGTVTLTVTPKGEGKVLLSIPMLKLKSNTSTTVVINGSTKLGYFTFTDSPMAAPPKAP